jgi:glycosyltransferase involved in cell wall biosynthesis
MKKRLLVLSHVLPLPGASGQQQRVKNTLIALREFFDVTFATVAAPGTQNEIEKQLAAFCDKVICLPSLYNQSRFSKLFHLGIGFVKSRAASLKLSNYIIGELEFSPARIAARFEKEKYDLVLFEYWHAFQSTDVFRRQNIPCVLDMHNILAQSYIERGQFRYLPNQWRLRQINRYAAAEIKAWNYFNAIIAINAEEYKKVGRAINRQTKIFYAPMGIDLNRWNFAWTPHQNPPRVAYYGGLGSRHNQQSALSCYRKIMPRLWQKFPETQFWIVGGNPPRSIEKLAVRDVRVKVTGYVENPQDILRTMTAVICPWTGIYGFRSRLVEVMAAGVPLVTTSDAVYGMELENERGVLIAEDDAGMSEKLSKLLADHSFAERQSRFARNAVERLYSFEKTYRKLAFEMRDWLEKEASTRNGAGAKSLVA